jgi:O-antigen ligase
VLHARQSWVAAGVLAAAAVLGGALAVDMVLALALLAGAAFVALLWYDLRLATALWVVLVFFEAIPALNAASRAAGVAVAFGWLVSLPQLLARRPLRGQGGLLVALGSLGVWLTLSLAWTVDVGNTVAALGRWGAVGVAFLVVATGMADRRAVRLGAAAFVAGAVLSVLVGAVNGSVGEEGRFEGTLGDPNLLAAGLVPAVVLVFGLAAGRRGVWWRGAAGAAVVVLGLGLAASGSRGAVVGAIATLAAALAVVRRPRVAVVVAGSAIALAAIAAALWLNPSAWARSSSLEAGSGRADLWKVAWHMAGDHPLTGVGPDNYPEVAGDYVRDVGPLQDVDLIAVEPHEAHNLYLQLLAETGVVGLALFVAFAVACLRSAWRAAQRFTVAGDRADAALARATVVASVGMLVSAAFISVPVDRRLWVLLALGPALLAAARPVPAQ